MTPGTGSSTRWGCGCCPHTFRTPLRYNREADPVCKGVFRSTLFPPDPHQEKGSGLPELVEEICRTIGLEEPDTDR